MENTEMLHELCETISRELEECNEKIRKAGGELSPGDIDYLDKLTHSLKSIKTTIAMMESEGGYSNRYWPMTYDDGSRYETRNSYARRRDSMGRYSRNRGYSMAEDDMSGMMDDLRELMPSLPEEKRREVQRFVDKMGRM